MAPANADAIFFQKLARVFKEKAQQDIGRVFNGQWLL
jgi:hypothetical protein